MLRLLTFGGLAIETGDGSPAPKLRPQRLAILAVLASAGPRGVSRERLAAYFWPEADAAHARHSLRQALYALRQELGRDAVRADALLVLDPEAVASDVGAFREALAANDHERAASLVTGPFLHAFFLPGAAEFERWVEEERTALTADAARVLRSLATRAGTAGDHDAAADWWRRLTILDPLSGRYALGFLKALAARGDRAGALAFARAHESVVRRELEADADPEIHRLEAQLRALPSPAVDRGGPSAPGSVAKPGPAATAVEPSAEAPPRGHPDVAGIRAPHGTAPRAPGRRLRRLARVAAGVVGLVALTGLAATRGWLRALGIGGAASSPTFAVGMIREDGVPDTLRIGGVLTDMLSTNLARVAGLSVLANSRLFELMLPGQDTLPAGYSEAARRAGATEILQGRLLSGPQWGLALELQRVDLATGLVRGAYRVAANDRYALIDSMTAAIARDLRLGLPASSVADATTESPMAYRLYEEGLRAYYQYDQPAARRLMQAALQEDSTFAMAAYYQALLTPGGGLEEVQTREFALRIAAHAPERERLTITADLLTQNMDPAAIVVAESLATKYPGDPQALSIYATALHFAGRWHDAVATIERAIALDSASEPVERQNCRLCSELNQLEEVYFWWDSLPAAERTAERYLRLRPQAHYPWHVRVRVAAALGRADSAREYVRRLDAEGPVPLTLAYFVRYATLAEDYEGIDQESRALEESPRHDDAVEGRWLRSIQLRNQGRIAEALRLSRVQPSPNDLGEAMIAIERGDARRAVVLLGKRASTDQSMWPSGVRARHGAWDKTLYGMALAAAGDTAPLRALADTVEELGRASIYGRDGRLHHYLRGMLLVAEGRDAAAVEELREAIFSPSNGFTRVNYELGKALLRLERPAEAVPVVRAALHGDIDGSNLYVTRTDLHELLGDAFDRLAMPDSAAAHYGAVVRAWAQADPLYHARRERARRWLARHAPSTGPSRDSVHRAARHPVTGSGVPALMNR